MCVPPRDLRTSLERLRREGQLIYAPPPEEPPPTPIEQFLACWRLTHPLFQKKVTFCPPEPPSVWEAIARLWLSVDDAPA